MRILYHNEIDLRDPADFSSERSNFWATNVKIHHLVVPWRTLVVDDQYYLLDAGVGLTITADCAAIAAHNLTAAATIKIQPHPTNDWGAPDLDETITWSAGNIMHFFTSTAKRFWRFYFDDPGNTDGYIHIGRLGLGAYLQMPGIEPEAKLPVATTSKASTVPGGQVYGDRGLRLKAPAFVLPIVSEAQRQAIWDMFDEVENIKPVFLAVWEDDLSVEAPIYCRIDQERLDFKRGSDPGLLWSLELQFMEVT
jgi:hypothetical protein